MMYERETMEENAVLQTAARMCAAARTAPKGHGKDTLKTLVFTGEEKDKLADAMEVVGRREIGDEMWRWYGRDAANIRNAQAVVLIGAEQVHRGVPHCGFCNHENCSGCKEAGGNCGFAYVDLGIAISSAVNIASLDHIDCRIMYSVGKTVAEQEYGTGYIWLGIPLSVSGKNIFFDRGITHK